MSGKKAKAARQADATHSTASRRRQSPKTHRPSTAGRSRRALWLLLAVPLIIAGLYGLTAIGKGGGGNSASGDGKYQYAVGSPGPGAAAPPLKLPSTAGGTFDLASYRGKAQVLLYFQEGLTCEPCWDQMQAIQKDIAKFHALGIGPIVSITTDPLDQIKQKVQDEGLAIPVLSDVGATYSSPSAWGTNQYQMQMMGDRNGHSFILVGKNGRIRWRADYGGAPNYTMFVPDDRLLADLRQGMNARS